MLGASVGRADLVSKRPAMPSGALGIWYAKDYVSSPRKAIPNSVVGGSTSNNLLIASSNLPVNVLNGSSNVTETRRAATGPTSGVSSASRIVGTGNCYYATSLTLPAGNYTLAAHVISNTGASQSFRMGDFSVGTFQTFSATTSWQRLFVNFTVGSTGNHFLMWARTPDGTTGWDLLIDNIQVFAGSSDLGADSMVGHLYFDADPKASGNASSPSTGVVDLSPGGSGLIQFASQAISQFTSGAMVQRVAAAKTFSAIFANPVLGYTTFSQFISDGTNHEGAFFGSQIAFSGMWDQNGKGWHLVAHRYDGTNYCVFFDGALVYKTALSATSKTIDCLTAFCLNSIGSFTSDHQMNSAFFYPAALTDWQIKNQVWLALKARAQTDGLTINPSRISSAEGDSITADANSYYVQFTPNANPVGVGINYAVAGSTIANLQGRKASVIQSVQTGATSIITVLVGANDLDGYAGANDTASAQNWAAALFSYTDDLRAAGYKVGICTVLPKGDGVTVHNTRRAIANPLIRSAAGTHCDFVIDFDTDAQMGIDTSFSTYPADWTDSIHPSSTGHARLEPIYRAAVNAVI